MTSDCDIRIAHKSRRGEWRFAYYAPGERMAPHRHDCAQFSLVMTGAQRECANGNEVDTSAMSMALKPDGFRHAAEFAPSGALLLSINLYDCDDDDRNLKLNTWRVRDSSGVRREWAALARAMNSREPAGGAIEDVTDDLITAMLNYEQDPSCQAAPRWLLRAREAIVETELGVDDIARDNGVHRVHLSRSFRRYFGLSITEQRRRARLARAATAIIADRSSLATASALSGFADQAHLTRDMRRETGMTPGALARIFRA